MGFFDKEVSSLFIMLRETRESRDFMFPREKQTKIVNTSLEPPTRIMANSHVLFLNVK